MIDWRITVRRCLNRMNAWCVYRERGTNGTAQATRKELSHHRSYEAAQRRAAYLRDLPNWVWDQLQMIGSRD
jgi:hypothetical protein